MKEKVTSNLMNEVLNSTHAYLKSKYDEKDLKTLENILISLTDLDDFCFDKYSETDYSYENVQEVLSTLNEKESIRKNKGVYYTPVDVVRFILLNSIKSAFSKLKSSNLHVMDLNKVPYNSLCTTKRFLDPTCGAGEFLLATLDIKMDLLDSHFENVTKSMLQKTVKTIYGNDINKESTSIAKIRLFLCALRRYGLKKCNNLNDILNQNFTNFDFVTSVPPIKKGFDVIVGNPPYVEDAKSDLNPKIKYGNIYANVLINSVMLLNLNGVVGYIIPLSYVSTPRMSIIRNNLLKLLPEQYILSYADRPDCLFKSVHQKLCILIGKKRSSEQKIYSSNYQYWYREERINLFEHTSTVKNNFLSEEYIPKLGTTTDVNVYKKICKFNQRQSLFHMVCVGNESVYLNMRAAFWIKAFRNFHAGSEYKKFDFIKAEQADYFFCIVNSSLFWWYWICVSDCWHITNKELQGFMTPTQVNYKQATRLAKKLEDKLEETKLYVGTKQTEYEYKHKSCIEEIHLIDDYINRIFELTEYESLYIKNFSYRYRVGGGAEHNESD